MPVALPTIVLKDKIPGRRINEPVTFTVDSELQEDVWTATTNAGETVICQRLHTQPVPGKTNFITVVSFEGSVELTWTRRQADTSTGSPNGNLSNLTLLSASTPDTSTSKCARAQPRAPAPPSGDCATSPP
jgi:hypothetical protein